MALDQLRDKITTVIGSNGEIQVFFLLRDGDRITVRMADLEGDETMRAMKELFCGYLSRTIVQDESVQLCRLSTADDRAGSMYLYDYEDYPEELDIMMSFDIAQYVDTIKFSFDSDSLSQLHGYIIYIGTMQNGLVLFKKHYPISLIKRDSFLLGGIKHKGRFKKLDGEDIVRINEKVELIRVDDQLVVLDVSVLERNLGFERLISRRAEDLLAAIAECGLVDDVRALAEAAKNISYARKLSRLKDSSPILTLNISKKVIIAFIQKTPEVAPWFKISPDGEYIVLDTKKSRDSFLKLLSDSYLRSELTRLYYDALAKENISSDDA